MVSTSAVDGSPRATAARGGRHDRGDQAVALQLGDVLERKAGVAIVPPGAVGEALRQRAQHRIERFRPRYQVGDGQAANLTGQ